MGSEAAEFDSILIKPSERKNYYLYSDLGRAKKVGIRFERKIIKVYSSRDHSFLGYTLLKGK